MGDGLTRRHTDRLVIALVVSLVGLVGAAALGRAAVAMLVTPWFVLLVLGLAQARIRRPTVAVTADRHRVMVGDEIDLTVTVSGVEGIVAVTAEPGGRLGSPSQPPTPARAMTSARGDGVEVTVALTADRWGTHDVGRIRLDVLEPYGLLVWQGTLTDPTPVRIHPRSEQIRTLLAPWWVRRTTGAHRSRTVGRGVEYADLRRFGPGDSLRDINWRVSARTDDLWVSQRHPDRATDVILLLDSFVESGHDVTTVFGLAVEATIALAESHLAVTDRVGLVEIGGLVRWVVPGTGRVQLQRLVDALLATSLLTNVADRDLTMIAPRALPPRSFVLAVSPLLDQRFTTALHELAGRGHDVAVVDCLAVATRPDEGDGQPSGDRIEALARRLWRAERDLLRGRLARRGIAVTTWQPGTPLDVTLDALDRTRRRVSPMVRR